MSRPDVDRAKYRVYLQKSTGRYHCVAAAPLTPRLLTIALERVAEGMRTREPRYVDCGTEAEHARVAIEVERIAGLLGLEGFAGELLNGYGVLAVYPPPTPIYLEREGMPPAEVTEALELTDRKLAQLLEGQNQELEAALRKVLEAEVPPPPFLALVYAFRLVLDGTRVAIEGKHATARDERGYMFEAQVQAAKRALEADGFENVNAIVMRSEGQWLTPDGRGPFDE